MSKKICIFAVETEQKRKSLRTGGRTHRTKEIMTTTTQTTAKQTTKRTSKKATASKGTKTIHWENITEKKASYYLIDDTTVETEVYDIANSWQYNDDLALQWAARELKHLKKLRLEMQHATLYKIGTDGAGHKIQGFYRKLN